MSPAQCTRVDQSEAAVGAAPLAVGARRTVERQLGGTGKMSPVGRRHGRNSDEATVTGRSPGSKNVQVAEVTASLG